MRAVVVQNNQTIAVEDRPVPTPVENEILVKVEAIALNPADWKHVDFIPTAIGNILGCDFYGTVVQVAKGSKSNVAIGDHVAGFIHGARHENCGAFANYVTAKSDLVWVVPEGTISPGQAAAMGCGFWTAVQALFNPTRLNLAWPPSRTGTEKWIFIYGGSTSVGQYAIQLAHLAGYKVATVASPRNHALVKSLGADVVFDYNSPNAVSEIKKATGDTVHASLDTVSLEDTQSFSLNVLAPGPCKMITILPVQESVKGKRLDVEIQFTVIYTALGHAVDMVQHFPASPDDRAHMAEFLLTLPSLVKDAAVIPNKVKLWDGGLDGIKDGLQYMREGKVSAEKIVYTL